MDYILHTKIVFEGGIHSKAVLLVLRKTGDYEYSIEICMISPPIKVT